MAVMPSCPESYLCDWGGFHALILHGTSSQAAEPPAPREPEGQRTTGDTVTEGSGLQGSTSAKTSGEAGGVTAAGGASVENQEDMADLALVKAPPTD